MSRTAAMVVMLAALVLALRSGPLTAAEPAADPFVGTWKIKVTPDAASKEAGEKEFEDTLIFEGGKLTATECVPYGFNPSPYSTYQYRAASSFESKMTSDEHGTAVWSGEVSTDTPDQIGGTKVWTKKDGNAIRYTFTGERQK